MEAGGAMFGWTEDPTSDTAHRPWRLPDEPWIMAQRWSDLLFAHWRLPADTVRPLLPASLPLDTYDGSAWISVASFYLSHLRPHGLPALPFVSEFPELNVRTYTSLDEKPGVYFFSLDAGSALAVEAARTLYHLPYLRAAMRTHRDAEGVVSYDSRRTDPRGAPAQFRARYRAAGPIGHSAPGTLDHWLTERYCLYAVDRARRIHRAEIHHHQWPLQSVRAEIETNTMVHAIGMQVGAPERVAFASMIDVVVWRPHLVRA
jgi:uncharacterized protein YqjF (DUF2071 family)